MKKILLTALFSLLVVNAYAASKQPLGSSVSATSPQQASDATTGLYSAGSGKVDVSISGSNIHEWTSSGEAITGTLAVSGNVSVNTNKFTVAAANGNTVIGGTLTAASLSTAGTIGGSLCATSGGLVLYNSGANCFAGGGSAGGSNTQVQYNSGGSLAGSANFTFISPALTIGVAGSTTGQINLTGSTSGTITIQGQAAAGTFNWNLPTAAGSSGNILTSGGGTTNPMTWDTTTGSGTVVALATSPTLVTPNIGVATGTSLAASGVMSTGTNSGTNGQITFNGSTSGSVTLKSAAAAGTGTNFTLPATNGSNTNVLQTDGSGNTSWVAAGGGGSTAISSLTAGVGTNSIDSATNTQTWTWNTLASQIGLALSTNSTAAASNTQELFDIAMSGANGTTTQTTYGMKVANTHTGTSSTNVAANLSASGGTTNIALQLPAGAVTIGTTTPLSTAYTSTAAIVTILGNQNSNFPGLIVRNTNSGTQSTPVIMVQNDGTSFTGMQVQPTTGSPAGSGLYFASNAITFLSDIMVSGGGTDPIRFQGGGYANATAMQVSAGNPGTVQIGTTTNATNAELTVAGQTNSYGYAVAGTKFTASGCSNTTTVGGATAGSFASGTTGACTVTVTMGSSMTATNGWSCWASDQTTPANTYDQKTGGSPTTAVFTGTTVSGDVISFGCMAY